jgi:TolB protein
MRDTSAEIYVMNTDGTNQQRLTHNANAGFPGWSPDGTKILFASSSGISVINPDGTDQQRLTSGYDLYPTWSPVR